MLGFAGLAWRNCYWTFVKKVIASMWCWSWWWRWPPLFFFLTVGWGWGTVPLLLLYWCSIRISTWSDDSFWFFGIWVGVVAQWRWLDWWGAGATTTSSWSLCTWLQQGVVCWHVSNREKYIQVWNNCGPMSEWGYHSQRNNAALHFFLDFWVFLWE